MLLLSLVWSLLHYSRPQKARKKVLLQHPCIMVNVYCPSAVQAGCVLMNEVPSHKYLSVPLSASLSGYYRCDHCLVSCVTACWRPSFLESHLWTYVKVLPLDARAGTYSFVSILPPSGTRGHCQSLGVRGSSLPWLLYCMRSASWQGPSADNARHFAVRLKWMLPAEDGSDSVACRSASLPPFLFCLKGEFSSQRILAAKVGHWDVREHHPPHASSHEWGIFLRALERVQSPNHYIAWVIFP